MLSRLGEHLVAGGRMAVTHLPRQGGATAADARAAGERILEHLRAAGYVDAVLVALPLEPVPSVCALARRAGPAAAGLTARTSAGGGRPLR